MPHAEPASRTLSPDHERIERTRMPLGEHLQQLRGVLIRTIAATFIAMIVCLFFGGRIMQFLCIPLATALEFNGLPVTVRTLAPSESFMTYMNVCMAAGIFVASPYILYQFWSFVSVGLYDKERRIIIRYLPASLLLLLAGALFFFFVIGPICLSFFIGFGRDFDSPSWISPIMATSSKNAPPVAAAPADVDATSVPLKLPVIDGAPADPVEGDLWVDSRDHAVKLWLGGQAQTLAKADKPRESLISPEITLSNYMGFIASLTLIFAASFQTPLIVLALAKMHLVTPKMLRHYRRHVIVGLLITAAVVTPPDVFSQIALALPVYLLFEAGVLLARRAERAEAAGTYKKLRKHT